MIEFIIAIVIAGFIGYHLGVMVTAWRLKDIIYKEAKTQGLIGKDGELLDEPIKTPKNTISVSKLFVEKAQDMLYLYDFEKHTFICQGSTMEELAKLALQQKNIKYAAVAWDETMYMFIDGTVKISTTNI